MCPGLWGSPNRTDGLTAMEESQADHSDAHILWWMWCWFPRVPMRNSLKNFQESVSGDQQVARLGSAPRPAWTPVHARQLLRVSNSGSLNVRRWDTSGCDPFWRGLKPLGVKDASLSGLASSRLGDAGGATPFPAVTGPVPASDAAPWCPPCIPRLVLAPSSCLKSPHVGKLSRLGWLGAEASSVLVLPGGLLWLPPSAFYTCTSSSPRVLCRWEGVSPLPA